MVASGEPVANGIEETQRQQQTGNVPNSVPSMYPYPYPPPPGAMYPMTSPEVYQAGVGPNGQRVMAPAPYPYPPPQPGQQGQPVPPNGYAFPAMMPPPSASGNSGASPTSPTGPPMQYPFGMWYPGMPMQPPPGMMSQNGLPVPMNAPIPPSNPYPPSSQNQSEIQNPPNAPPRTDHQQQPPSGEQPQSNGANWGSVHAGGLPPKEVAKTIPCR